MSRSMGPIVERLKSLRVEHVMSRQVVAVSASDPMEAVAGQLLDAGVSAAPVVDEQNRLVGILSATDFLRRDRPLLQCTLHAPRAAPSTRDGPPPVPPARSAGSPQRPRRSTSVQATQDVAVQFMTTAVQTVLRGTPLLDAATIMSASHIHRLVVVDERHQAVGMVSTMDIVAALLNAIAETAA